MRIGIAALALAIGALAGCASRTLPVTLAGDTGSVRAVAGTWSGTYASQASGRNGLITFTIESDGDSAFGDVEMELPPDGGEVVPVDSPAAHRVHARGPRLLAVRFVLVIAGEVNGELEPYIAPDCGCTVRTTFTGYVLADTIRGSFFTRGRGIPPQTGVWSVIRARKAGD